MSKEIILEMDAVVAIAESETPEVELQKVLDNFRPSERILVAMEYGKAVQAYHDRPTDVEVVDVVLNDRSSQASIVQEADSKELMFLKCPNPNCGHTHFRHAGYIHPIFKYQEELSEDKAATTPCPVQVCVKCRESLIIYKGKIHTVTKYVDLKAWETFEKEAHTATGPGGQC